eukprot:scpid108459/ scgid26895/ 
MAVDLEIRVLFAVLCAFMLHVIGAQDVPTRRLCGGYDVRVHTRPMDYRTAIDKCQQLDSRLLRKKEHKQLIMATCYSQLIQPLLDDSMDMMWLTQGSNYAYNIRTSSVAMVPMDEFLPFICEKDWDECANAVATGTVICPKGYSCENTAGNYTCVLAPPTVQSSSERNLRLRFGETARFSVSLFVTPELFWRHNGKPINTMSASKL